MEVMSATESDIIDEVPRPSTVAARNVKGFAADGAVLATFQRWFCG